MTAKHVLSQALALLDGGKAHASPPRGTSFLAIDAGGLKVRPTDVRAVAWTSTGAVCKVAPVHRAKVWADLTAAGDSAVLLLLEAARKQGYPNLALVDREGFDAVYRCFTHAIDLYKPPPRRRLSAVGTGSLPRGTEAA